MKQMWGCDPKCTEISGIWVPPSSRKKESCLTEKPEGTASQAQISGGVTSPVFVLTPNPSHNNVKYDPSALSVFT